jgi:hypothetical protein
LERQVLGFLDSHAENIMLIFMILILMSDEPKNRQSSKYKNMKY